MTQQHKDHIVLAGFKEGDITVFQEVFEEFFPSLCYFATRLISDREEAEDIVLDIFSKLWQRRDQFETRANIKAFLYISTRNTCLNFLQHRQRRNLSQKELEYISGKEEGGEGAYDHELINALVMQEIHRQVEALPPQCRQVFKLIFFQNLSTAQVAERMGITSKTVLNQKLKAIALIRSELLKRKLFVAALFFYLLVNGQA